MKRVRNFYVSAVLSMACVGCLTAQDSLLLSGLSCAFTGNFGCDVHCVALCKKEISNSFPKTIFTRMFVSRLPLATFDSEDLCICKMLKLASYSKCSSMRTISSPDLGYQLKSHAAPFGSSMIANGLGVLAKLDSFPMRSSKRR